MENLRVAHGALSSTRSSIPSLLRPQTPFSRKPRIYLGTLFPATSLKSESSVVTGYGVHASLTPVQAQHAEDLKEKLFKAIDAADGSLDDSCLALVSSLEQLNRVPDIVADPDRIRGCLVAAKANFKENRRDGKVRHLGYLGALSSLGSLTFNVFKPVDLKIALYNMFQHVAMESAESYTLATEFSIVNTSEQDPSVQGLIINRGKFSVSGPNRLSIEFLSCEMRPRFPEKGLDSWLKLLKEFNPSMDDSGRAVVPFPMAFKGWSDVLYMDDEIRIQKGHKGGVSVLRLLKEAVVSV